MGVKPREKQPVCWDSSGLTAGAIRFRPSCTQAFFVGKRNMKKTYGVKVVRVSEMVIDSGKIDSPKLAVSYWRAVIEKEKCFCPDKEHLVVLLLNTKYHVRAHEIVSVGSMNESIAHPREIFTPAIAGGAFAIITMHNHPSGDPSPSQSDSALTERLRLAADLLQIKFLDHVIVGADRYFSFKERDESEKSQMCANVPALAGPRQESEQLELEARLKKLGMLQRKSKKSRQLADLETIVLSELYDRYAEMRFEDAVSGLAGLAELLAENNAPEVRALKTLVAANAVLNQIRAKVRTM